VGCALRVVSFAAVGGFVADYPVITVAMRERPHAWIVRVEIGAAGNLGEGEHGAASLRLSRYREGGRTRAITDYRFDSQPGGSGAGALGAQTGDRFNR
jgi:hypothetical protein